MREGSLPDKSSRMTRCDRTLRLARAGIGRNPRRQTRIGGQALALDCLRRDGEAPAHSPPSWFAIDASRPFARAGEVVVVAAHVVGAEGQRPRQIAGGRRIVVLQQLFRAAATRRGRDRRRCGVAGCIRGSIPPPPDRWGGAGHRPSSEGVSFPSSSNAPCIKKRALERQLGRQKRMGLALGRARPGLEIENVS